MFKRLILALGLFASGPAMADEIVITDFNVFSYLQHIAESGWNRPDAAVFVSTTMGYDGFQEADWALYNALIDEDQSSYQIKRLSSTYAALVAAMPAERPPTPGPGDVSTLSVAAPDPETRAFLVAINPLLNGNVDLDTYWLVEDQMEDFYLMAFIRGRTRLAIEDYVAGKFWEAWQLSTLENGYAPFRETFNEAFNALPSMSEDAELHLVGRELLSDSITKVDQHAEDAVPDFLYDWLVPSE